MAAHIRVYTTCYGILGIILYLTTSTQQKRVFLHNETNHDCWYPFQGNSSMLTKEDFFVYHHHVKPEDTCYYLPKWRYSYTRGETLCASIGPAIHLFSDDGMTQHRFVVDNVIQDCVDRDLGTECSLWLGLQWDRGCTWLDGTDFRWDNWPQDFADQCLEEYGERYCPKIDRTGTWDVGLCGRINYPLCEWTVDVPKTGSRSGGASAASAGITALIIIIVLILLLILLLLLFIVIGKYYVCKPMVRFVNLGVITNAPDTQELEKVDVMTNPKRFKTAEDFHNDSKNKRTDGDIPMSLNSDPKPAENLYQDVDEGIPDSDQPEAEREPFLATSGKPDSEMQPDKASEYAVPNRTPRKKVKDPMDEITVLERDVVT